jgi:hypothetical protein
MRTLLLVSFPTEKFNEAVRDGSADAKMKRILDDQKPEAVYFTELGGERTAIVVVDVKTAAQIPAFAEPWFLTFDAVIEFKMAMIPEDLAKAGLEKLGKKWG